MKYFKVLTDCSEVFAGSIVSESGLAKLISVLKTKHEPHNIPVEVVDKTKLTEEEWACYVPMAEIGNDYNSWTRNVKVSGGYEQ